MTIRFLTNDDIIQHEELAAICFVGEAEYDAKSLPAERVPGVFSESGKLMADLEIHEKTVICGGKLLRCAAVGGVACLPECRGMGLIKKLFATLDSEKDRYDLSVLYPFSEAYYKKLGYITAGDKITALVPFAFLKPGTDFNKVRVARADDISVINDICNAYAAHTTFTFYNEKLTDMQISPFTSKRYCYITESEDAYIDFDLSRTDSTVYVHEITYKNRSGFLTLMGFLHTFKSNFDNVCFEALPAGSPVFEFITEKNKAKITLSAFAAFKSYNFKNLLSARFSGGCPCAFSVEILNHGKYFVSADGTVGDFENETDIVVTDAAFTRLIFGGITKKNQIEFIEGVIFADEKIDFSKIFNKTSVRLLAGF